MSTSLAEQPAQRVLFIERPGEMWEFVGETFEDHLGCWQEIDGQVQKDKWKLSSVAASLDTKYKDKTIDRFAYETRRSARRIREYTQTYRAFENGERSPILSFHHHTVAATAENPIEAIHKAEDKEWSTRQLEHWIKTGIEPGEEQQLTEQEQKDRERVAHAVRSMQQEAMIIHCDESIHFQRQLKEKCPIPKIGDRIYSSIIEELEDIKKNIQTANIETALYDAVKQGYETIQDLAGFTGLTQHDVKRVVRQMVQKDMLETRSVEESRQDGRRGVMVDIYALNPDYVPERETDI
jgi:hypothetical protein